MSVLLFLGALVAIVAVAFTVNKIRGVRAHYIEDWAPEEGEHILFRDMEADTYIVLVNRALFVSYARPRRGAVIVTDKRIVAATKALFVRKKMILYMLYGGSEPGPYSEMIDGGLFTCGYQNFVYLPDSIERVTDEKKPYVVLKPSPSARSSINVDEIRIYTDNAALFPRIEQAVAEPSVDPGG
jgi:hypothetical protein